MQKSLYFAFFCKMNFERNRASGRVGGYEFYSEFESLLDKITDFNERTVPHVIKLMSFRRNPNLDVYRVPRDI